MTKQLFRVDWDVFALVSLNINWLLLPVLHDCIHIYCIYYSHTFTHMGLQMCMCSWFLGPRLQVWDMQLTLVTWHSLNSAISRGWFISRNHLSTCLMWLCSQYGLCLADCACACCCCLASCILVAYTNYLGIWVWISPLLGIIWSYCRGQRVWNMTSQRNYAPGCQKWFIPILSQAKYNISFSDVSSVCFLLNSCHVCEITFSKSICKCWITPVVMAEPTNIQAARQSSKMRSVQSPLPRVSLLEEVKGDSPNAPLPSPAGTALSQTTPSPTVMSTALAENVTSLTVTPVIVSSTTPGCTAFNLSTCEQCAPGTQYDNSESRIHHITLCVIFGFSITLKKKL